MRAPARSNRLPWLAALASVTLAAIITVAVLRGKAPAADQAPDVTAPPAGADTSGFTPQAELPALAADTTDTAETVDRAAGAEADPGDESADEYPVDLERVRARIPNNLYWLMGAPTKDPQALQARAEAEQRWNQLFGKVQSGTASEEEIQRYYDHRRQLSQDYIEMARLVLQEYASELPERDRGLYELSIEMHAARLAEIPRQIEDALARKQDQDRRREEWRRSQ
ncbi:MAG TPA: hypothetical protein VNM90_22425 [Haliangium sp.]|nr:hypothetical protein [Haliangium sp.]